MKLTFQTASVISALIEELEKDFPDTIPINNSPTIEDFRRLQGQQEVIQSIRNLVDTEDDKEDEG